MLLVYDIFRFGFFIVFVGLHALLMAGLVLERRRDTSACVSFAEKYEKPESNVPLPLVSIIVPIHNETRRMDGLLQSIKSQQYKNSEFIFINDRSTDGSAAVLREFMMNEISRGHMRDGTQDSVQGNGQSLPVMRIITLDKNPGPNYKQYALGKGIDASRGEFILFTDADCVIPPAWIVSMVKRMSDPKTGAVLGPVLRKPEGRGFFHLYQCFEHAVRYMYLAASTGIGAAGGGFGNNLILRRESLDAVGGYASVPPSPTEDAALISIIRSHSKYKVRAGLGKDQHVLTWGEDNWKDFVTQTLRWNNGGLFGPDIATRINFGFLMITISMGILAIPVLPFIPSLWPLSAAVILSMSANTIATLVLFGVSLPKKGAAYIIQCVFTPMYFTFLTILGFCGIRPKWKGSEK